MSNEPIIFRKQGLGLFPANEAAREQIAKCERCDGSGWLPALGPYPDGSYITSSPCPCSNVYAAHGLD